MINICLLSIALLTIKCIDINKSSKSSDYTMEYYYSLRVHEKYDAEFLLDTSKHYSTFFKNPEKPQHFLIEKKSDDELTETIEINGMQIKDFYFYLEEDNTLLFNDNCQGILGFGISDSGDNDLMDIMVDQKIIKSKVLYFTTSPYPKIQFPFEISKKQNLTFTQCSLSDRSDLDSKYGEMWACDMSHIIFDSGVVNTTLNDSIVVKTIAVFDAKSYYISAPLQYYEMFEKFYSNNKQLCSSYQLDEYTYLQCQYTNEDLISMKDVLFLFDGIAYPIKSEKMFMQIETNKYNSLIRFRNVTSKDENVWVFGFPFFSSYTIKFDFDEETIGFNGNNKVWNLTDEWNEWYKQNGSSSLSMSRIIQIIGWICFAIICVLVMLVIFKYCCKRKKKRSGGKKKFIELAEATKQQAQQKNENA